MNRLPLFAFDLDDTLISEFAYLRAAFKDLAERGFASLESLSRYRNAYLAISAEIPVEKQADAIEIYRRGDFDVEPAEGVTALLTRLKETGYPLAVITDGHSERQRNKLRKSGLLPFFNEIYISEEHSSMEKLSGEPFRIMENRFPDRSHIYIGDNPAKDFLQANRRGWKTIMLRNQDSEYVHPDSAPTPEHAPQIRVSRISDLFPFK